MTLHRGITIGFLVGVLSTATGGCSTMKTVHPVGNAAGASPFARVKVGQPVVIETQDGRRERVVVARIERDGIVSQQGRRFASKDILRIQRKTFSPLKAGLWTAAGIIIAAAVLSQMAFLPS